MFHFTSLKRRDRPPAQGIVKVDIDKIEKGERGETVIANEASFKSGTYGQEAVHTKAKGAREEDDAYLLSLLRDEEEGRSFAAVHSARSMERVCLYEVPTRVPYGFHGAYVPDDIAQGNGIPMP